MCATVYSSVRKQKGLRFERIYSACPNSFPNSEPISQEYYHHNNNGQPHKSNSYQPYKMMPNSNEKSTKSPKNSHRKNTSDSSFQTGQNDHMYDPRDSPRLIGYIGILIASIITFASCADVDVSGIDITNNEKNISVMFGAVSFCVTLVVVILHYVQLGKELFVPKGSTLEGVCITCLCIWWIPAVTYMTRVDGIAYQALNIYFFSWLALILSVYTLNNLLECKGFFSASSLTGSNEALGGWIGLFLGSLVEFGSALDARQKLESPSDAESAWAVTVGIVSMIIALVIIAAHFIQLGRLGIIIHGTDIQLYLGVFLVMWWIIGVSILTDSGKFGSLLGPDCATNDGEPLSVSDWRAGSNMYFSLWFSFFAACIIVVKWRKKNVQDLTLQPMSAPVQKGFEDTDI